MKNCTDIKQSKKLAEILPIESADLWWAERYAGQVTINGQYIVEEKPTHYLSFTKPSDDNYSQDIIKDIPCWSLAALLSIIPNYKLSSEHNYHTCTAETSFGKETVGWFDTPIDACVEMIIKLKENKVL